MSAVLGSERTGEKKRLLSGMQPTGNGLLHLGNYEGALKPWVALQDQYEMFCFVADWHALTTLAGTGESIADASRAVVLDYLSAGLDPDRCAIFRQSKVTAHAELSTLLGMVTPVSWLERVPTYKEKRELVAEREHEAAVSYGLLGYPVLQAADILLYRAHAVPVGKDQAAHLELTREIARRFNHLYQTELFPTPQAVISEDTGVLPGLDADAGGKLRKMSKSYHNTILLTDSADTVAQKLKGAFTSPLKVRKDDPGVPEGCSVCQLRRLYDPSGYSAQWDECRSGARGCSQSKRETTEILNAVLDPIRARRAVYASDPAELERVLERGEEKARAFAETTMQKVRETMLLV
ncbi:MAG: tryptophan--tRNA ligase [Cytophagales bacterium]|nr:tryptophan--tRNA ligase [Armatimonadota bacterium]